MHRIVAVKSHLSRLQEEIVSSRAYLPILEGRKYQPYGERERRFQP